MILADRNNGVKSLIGILSTMLTWALMSLLFVIFYSACLNPSHEVVIDVNGYGEMLVEAVLFAFIWIMTTVNMVDEMGSRLR